MFRLYAFTGYPASGKSTACDIAAEEGYETISMGRIVHRRAKEELGPNLTSESKGEWATQKREDEGEAVFARATADSIESRDDDTIVVDGVRAPVEIETFRDRFDDVTVVFVDTPFETRLERIQARDRDGEGDFDSADLESRDAREESWGVANLVANDHYDCKIENTGTFEAFRTTVLDLLEVSDEAPLADGGDA